MDLLKLWNVSQIITLTATVLFCLDENKVVLSHGTCNFNRVLIFLNYYWLFNMHQKFSPTIRDEKLTSLESHFLWYSIDTIKSSIFVILKTLVMLLLNKPERWQAGNFHLNKMAVKLKWVIQKTWFFLEQKT